MHRPPRWRPSRRQPPPLTWVSFVHGYSGPPGVTAMVVAHFFESASDAVYVGPSRERTAMAAAVALASTGYIASIDERPGAGPRSARPGRPGFPTAWPTFAHRRQLESRGTRGARSSHPFGGGGAWIAAQLRPPGTGL